MASETVNKILEAEAEAEKRNADARRRAEEIINSAKSKAAVAVQKKLTEAMSESDKIRNENQSRLSDYISEAAAECNKTLEALENSAEKNMDAAVDSIIKGFFS